MSVSRTLILWLLISTICVVLHDVGAMNYGIFSRREWFVLHELESWL